MPAPAARLTANRLRRLYGDDAEIIVVDRDDRHVYQPGLLFVPFGLAQPEEHRPAARCAAARRDRVPLADVDRVEIAANEVHLGDGGVLPYDVLVVATGARLLPEETEGLTGPGLERTVFTFYTLEGATALREALRRFDGGRLVVNLVDMPIKCPVAPLEFCFLADWYLRERGVRDDVELTYVTPLDGAFTKPVAAEHLGGHARREGHRARDRVQHRRGRRRRRHGSISYDEREVPLRPARHRPAARRRRVRRALARASATSSASSPPTSTRCSRRPRRTSSRSATRPTCPTSKAGSVTHFEGETLVENVRRFLAGEPLEAGFDGHANCFIETGFHKALLIDFNYDTEPLPGHFPEPRRPLPLLKESRLNHLGKLMFQWVYWHVLLPGREIPGIGSQHAAAPPTRRRHDDHHDHRSTRPSTSTPRASSQHPEQWTEAMAAEIARSAGHRRADRPPLAGRPVHARQRTSTTGTAPTIRTLGKASGVPVKELYQLFPKGPAKLAAKIAGIPKPRGCI